MRIGPPGLEVGGFMDKTRSAECEMRLPAVGRECGVEIFSKTSV
jgi:hypothetical protein